MNPNNNNQLEEVSLIEIWTVLFQSKVFIILTVLIFSGAAVAYAVSLPNLYRSEVKLMSTGDSSANLSSLAGGLGGIASLAGINIGGSGSGDNSVLAVEMLKSRKFLKNFVDKHDLLVPLIAAEGVDDKGDLIINPALYNVKTKQWVRKVRAPKPVVPSAEDVFGKFKKILAVEQDSKSGTTRITLEFFKPELSQKWLSLLVKDINEVIRELDMKEAGISIEYLKETAAQTKNTAMQQTFYQLIEEQTKTLLLTKVRKEYVYKTIDPATFPEEKASPKRALICIIITLLGGILSVAFVLIRYFLFVKKS